MKDFCRPSLAFPSSFLILTLALITSCAHKNTARMQAGNDNDTLLSSEDAPATADALADDVLGTSNSNPTPIMAEKTTVPEPYKRSSASTSKKGFFATTVQSCSVFEDASEKSKKIKTLSASKKIWVEETASGWFKIFLKHSTAFLRANCVGK